jgi:hypothetical protein
METKKPATSGYHFSMETKKPATLGYHFSMKLTVTTSVRTVLPNFANKKA